MFLLRLVEAVSHASLSTTSIAAPLVPKPTFFFLIPQLSHPLSTPFAPTMLLSPHRLALNRLLWNLFKYFDISPPLTSRAEMICDSWRWARSEELPLTPCPPPPSPSPYPNPRHPFVERPIFSFD